MMIATNETTSVTYHTTKVVSWSSSEIVLRTGGWRTATTKARMNQAAQEHGLGFRVSQISFDWFVDYKGKRVPFSSDTVTLKR
jgi:hypothetical protein